MDLFEMITYMQREIYDLQRFGGGVPTGSIIEYGGSGIPTGFLDCDGAAVSRTTYVLLFNIIGTTYGVGNGTTTFNVPNQAGKIIKT